MSYTTVNGYTPKNLTQVMVLFMEGINEEFGTTYSAETFIGTNFYKYFYAAAQLVVANEVNFGEAFNKLRDYIRVSNERIQAPVTTKEGMVQFFAESELEISVSSVTSATAGTTAICVNLDEADEDYAEQKILALTLLSESVVAGAATSGDQSGAVVLENGQSFDFYFSLPDKTETLLKAEFTVSRNQSEYVETDEDITEKIFDKMNEIQANGRKLYSVGLDFEPSRYATSEMFPWASSITVTYSTNSGVSYTGDVFEAEFDDLLDIPLENIEVIIS